MAEASDNDNGRADGVLNPLLRSYPGTAGLQEVIHPCSREADPVGSEVFPPHTDNNGGEVHAHPHGAGELRHSTIN